MKQFFSLIACSMLLFSNTGCYAVVDTWRWFWGCDGGYGNCNSCGYGQCQPGCNSCNSGYAPTAGYYPAVAPQAGCGCENQGVPMMQPGPAMYAPANPMMVPVGPTPVGPTPDPNLLPHGTNTPKMNPVTQTQMQRGQIIYVQTVGHQQ